MLSTLAKHAAPLARLGCILALLAIAAAARAQGNTQGRPARPARQSIQSLIHPRTDPNPLPVKFATHITTVVINNKITTFSFGSPVAFQTSDPLGVYSGRPLLAVGDVVSVDSTSHTVKLAIKRDLSSLPHKLELDAKKKKVYEKLLDREFPTTRTFATSRLTQILDGARLKNDTARLETNRDRLARITIKLEDLRPGDRVSVTYRMNENPQIPPTVFNISKQDPNRREYEADYRAMPIIRNNTAQTTPTLAGDRPSTRTLARNTQAGRKTKAAQRAPMRARP